MAAKNESISQTVFVNYKFSEQAMSIEDKRMIELVWYFGPVGECEFSLSTRVTEKERLLELWLLIKVSRKSRKP